MDGKEAILVLIDAKEALLKNIASGNLSESTLRESERLVEALSMGAGALMYMVGVDHYAIQ